MFIPLLTNSQHWIIHMAGYHCSGFRNRTKVTSHKNDEYELFCYVYASKCVVTFVPLRFRKLMMVTTHVSDLKT